MNDADWLRKHLRGKTQRAVAQTSDSRVRRLVGRVLKRIRPPEPDPTPEPDTKRAAQD